MFGMGMQEILLILVIGVLIIGPEQLPQVARTIGKLVAHFKRTTNELRHAMSDELEKHEELEEFRKFSNEVNSGMNDIGATARGYIEKEVEREEAVLKELEQEVRADPDADTDMNDSTQAGNASAGKEEFPTMLDEPAEPEASANTGNASKKESA